MRIRRVLAIAAMLAIPAAAGGQDTQPTEAEQAEVWLERAISQLPAIEVRHRRVYSTSFAIMYVAGTGDYDRAFDIADRFLSEDERISLYRIIASIQSERDDLAEAMETRERFDTSWLRDLATALIAIRQAQRGDPDDALALIPQIDDPERVDSVLRSTAEAQADMGEPEAARITAEKIADDRLRQQVLDGIENIVAGRRSLLNQVKSPMIADSIGFSLMFNDPDSWQVPAVLAIIAAQNGDEVELDRRIRETLQAVESGEPIGRISAKQFLTAALAMAGRRAEARALLQSALAEDEDWAIRAVTSMFGRPMLVYALLSAGMEDEVEQMVRRHLTGDSQGTALMMHIGQARGELGHIEQAQATYERLSAPADRAKFALGVYAGITGRAQAMEE